MSVRMAAPWANPRTGVLYLRQRTPRDVVNAMRGQTVRLPIAEKMVAVRVGDVVQVSLETKDINVAKERHAAADARLRSIWARAREAARIRENGIAPRASAKTKSTLAPEPYVSPDMATAMRQFGDAAREGLRQQGRPVTAGSVAGMVGNIIEAFDALEITPRLAPYFENGKSISRNLR